MLILIQKYRGKNWKTSVGTSRGILPQDGPSELVNELCQIPGGPRADPRIENRLPTPPSLDSGPQGCFENNARELDFKDLQS